MCVFALTFLSWTDNGLMDRSKVSLSQQTVTVGSGSDFLQLSLDDAPRGHLTDRLAGLLRAAIADARLPVGSRLPATRVLAADLRVSRGVVTEAYRRLGEDGLVTANGRGGTSVVAAPAIATTAPRNAPTTTLRVGPGPRTANPVLVVNPGTDIFDAMRSAPARIDLTPGVPDLAAFPRAAWLRAERTVLRELSASSFGYSDPRGTPTLRAAVAEWLARYRGISADPGDVLIVAGVAQALVLLAQVLREGGTTAVAVEDPGSLGARQQLQSLGLRTPPIPVDADGLRVDLLRESAAETVMLTPAHQFPTGAVLGGTRRRDLMDWAHTGGLIIEDDYDAEHRYDRRPVPALRAMLPEHVCYAGSVSKLLAPALRIGWILAPARYQDALVSAKRIADLGNPALAQLTLAHLMQSGDLERHLRQVRRQHQRRRDAMIHAIAKHLPAAVVHGAAAGLHLMITFDNAVDDVALAGAALDRGVKTQPLTWHSQRAARSGLVLGYAASTPSQITEAIATLAEVLPNQQ